MMVTTNLPFDEWTEVFGSERLTGALLDRLTHHVHIAYPGDERPELPSQAQPGEHRNSSSSRSRQRIGRPTLNPVSSRSRSVAILPD